MSLSDPSLLLDSVALREMCIRQPEWTHPVNVWLKLQDTEGDAFYTMVGEHVWDDLQVCTFFMGWPYKWAVMRMRQFDVTGAALLFLQEVIVHGGSPLWIAASITSMFVDELTRKPLIDDTRVNLMVSILSMLCRRDTSVVSILNDRLFFLALSVHVNEDTLLSITELLLLMSLEDYMKAYPTIERLNEFASMPISTTKRAYLFRFLATLGNSPLWESMMIELVDRLLHKYKRVPLESHPLLLSLMSDTSVRFVVVMARTHKLGIVRGCGPSIAAAVERQWPTDQRPAGEETKTCPITLHPMRNPVVASDGHTYERWAILEHMSRVSMNSPLTNTRLQYTLFRHFSA